MIYNLLGGFPIIGRSLANKENPATCAAKCLEAYKCGRLADGSNYRSMPDYEHNKAELDNFLRMLEDLKDGTYDPH